MDCRHVDRLLEANLDGRLNGFERASLRQHVRTCSACRAKLDAMTAFAATVERTFACADGPDWQRLAPPSPPAAPPAEVFPERPIIKSAIGMAEPPPRPLAPPPRRTRSAWMTVVLVVAATALLVPLFKVDLPRRVAPLDEALAVEATRFAAGAGPDYQTNDLGQAVAWLAERGVPGAPVLTLSDDLTLEGAYLTFYDDDRVGGLAFTGSSGAVRAHLRVEPEPTGPRTAIGHGLEAAAKGIGDWELVVIAPTPVAGLLSTLTAGVPADAVPAAVDG